MMSHISAVESETLDTRGCGNVFSTLPTIRRGESWETAVVNMKVIISKGVVLSEAVSQFPLLFC